ncbi:hypothetical protein [Thalassobellus sediminis]|uniref:hypothetical protein n=1 Tax=Thalassobellus sediminis TaxID=3367753 RepID=UPI0037A747FA
MQTIKEHIVFKIVTLSLVATLLVPSVIKFSHVFSHHHHKHDVCKGEKSTHLHEIDLDCEFYKFQLNKNYIPSLKYETFICKAPHYKIYILTYKFLNNHQPLSYSLRGPPAVLV